jgi:hypothetical protein
MAFRPPDATVGGVFSREKQGSMRRKAVFIGPDEKRSREICLTSR